MLRNILLLALVSCALLVTVQSWSDMTERLKNRVIHVESLLKRGRWLWRNDNTDADGSHYLYVDELAERDTYYRPKVQFQTKLCGESKYLCLECLASRDYYLAAGYPAGGTKHTVKLEHSTYTEDEDRFHWKIMCESDDMEKCKLVAVRFETTTEVYLMTTDNWGSEDGHDGGHYDATLGIESTTDTSNKPFYRVHAPNPSDNMVAIYSNTNEGTIEQLVKYSMTIGVTQTQTTTETVGSSTSIEIGASFKAFSSSATSTIEQSWTETDSTTYEVAKTVEHDLKIQARTAVVLKQLKGNYANEFTVGNDIYTIHETPLDSGPTRSRTIRIKPGKRGKGKRDKKEEL